MCEHNTAGTNCETCLTGFNSRPWQPGNETHANECTGMQAMFRSSKVLFVHNTPYTCFTMLLVCIILPVTLDLGLACMCNMHAQDCYYNQTLMAAVCIDCGDNTTGDDCSSCLPSFYETSMISSDPNFCQGKITNKLTFLHEFSSVGFFLSLTGT